MWHVLMKQPHFFKTFWVSRLFVHIFFSHWKFWQSRTDFSLFCILYCSWFFVLPPIYYVIHLYIDFITCLLDILLILWFFIFAEIEILNIHLPSYFICSLHSRHQKIVHWLMNIKKLMCLILRIRDVQSCLQRTELLIILPMIETVHPPLSPKLHLWSVDTDLLYLEKY